jgi:hypothetical protein
MEAESANAGNADGGSTDEYRSQIGIYVAAAQRILKAEEEILSRISSGDDDSAAKRLVLADEMLNLVSNYIAVNGVHMAMLKTRDEGALAEARKALYKSVAYAEEVVTPFIDAPFSEYKQRLEAIESVSPAWRYFFVRKTGLSIDLLANAYGDNTKWRWAFVELKGRFVAVAKNFLNLDRIVQYTDMRSAHYEPTVYHLKLVKKLLETVAEGYRKKYELSSNSIADFKKSLDFLAALRQLCLLSSDTGFAETVKKRIDVWNSKLTSDIASRKAKNG